MDQEHKNQLIADLDIHLSFNRHIFPLSPNTKIPPKGLQWRRRQFGKTQLISYIKKGYNLAWALGLQDLVIDLDPREKLAKKSFLKLQEDINIKPKKLSDLTATVNTGGIDQGQHYYFCLPSNIKIKTKINEYPNLQFKRHGSYVVIPGSLHPSGQYYEWDYFSPYTEKPISIPQNLLNLIELNEFKKKKNEISQNISIEEIQHYLNQLDPKNFRSRQSWIELAFMVHSAIGEAGRDIFFSWSANDNFYDDCQEENIKIWESIKDDKSNLLTFGSLIQKVIDQGGRFYQSDAKKDFKEYSPNAFLEKIRKTPLNPTTKKIKSIIQQSLDYGENFYEDKVRKEIKQSLNITFGQIDKLKKEIDKNEKSKKIKPYLTKQIGQLTLENKFEEGKHLLHARNQQFYHYIKTHWESLPENELGKSIRKAGEQIRDKSKSTFDPIKQISLVTKWLTTETVVEGIDVFNFKGEPKSIINCANGELWIDPNTGKYQFKKHDPKSYLLNCLSTNYDLNAKCPIWVNALQNMFYDYKNSDDVIRHLHEIFGYLIQPNKNIASWFLWHGLGNNGKSTCIDILQELIGRSAIFPCQIHQFKKSSSNHLSFSLVGKLLILDDDASTEEILPSSYLKKLAETKLWRADPKFKDAFEFRSSASLLISCNGWPKIKDISHGMLRRVFIMDFNRRFLPNIDDILNLKNTIIEKELSGILNLALEGLQRLRKRGAFLEPTECIESKKEWLRRSNYVLDWLHNCCTINNNEWTSIYDLYQSYLNWSIDAGIKRYLNRIDIENDLLQLNFESKMCKSIRGFSGIKIN